MQSCYFKLIVILKNKSPPFLKGDTSSARTKKFVYLLEVARARPKFILVGTFHASQEAQVPKEDVLWCLGSTDAEDGKREALTSGCRPVYVNLVVKYLLHTRSFFFFA